PRGGLQTPQPPAVLRRCAPGEAPRGSTRRPPRVPATFDRRATARIPAVAGAGVGRGDAETAFGRAHPGSPAARWNLGQKNGAPTLMESHPGWWIKTVSRQLDRSWCSTLMHDGPAKREHRPVGPIADQPGGVGSLGFTLRLW